MGDKSGGGPGSGPNHEKNRGRRSLVERVAERMAATTARAEARPKEAAPPSATEETVAAAIAEAAQPPEAAELPTAEQESPEIPLAVAAAPAGRPAQGAPGNTNGTKRRRSRIAKIDTAHLMTRNIITPETKRNQTVEEFRLIKRMVLSRRWDQGGGPGNTVLVTSALPSEGKTTTAINLAMSIAAEEDLRVLLVDADFIKPDALRQLGVSARKGLIDVIQDPRMDIADVMLKTDIDTLSLIPSGQLHDRCTELLASARMSEVIKELANRYDDRILIFDSPPILATTESVTMASHMGQIVFVVQAGRTNRESVQSALELIGDRPNLGLMLNRISAQFGKSGFGAYYGSYYYGYGKQEEVSG